MKRCISCGEWVMGQLLDRCPVCYPLFEEDKKNGRFPAPFVDVPELQTYALWCGVREIERCGTLVGKSKAQIAAEVMAYAKDRRERWEEAQRTRKKEADINTRQAEVRSRYSL